MGGYECIFDSDCNKRRRPKKTSLFVPTEASFLLSCCTTHIKWMTEFRLENRKKRENKKICMRKGFSEQQQHQTTIQNWSQTRNRHINFVAGLYNLAIFICLRKKSHKQGFSQSSGNRKLLLWWKLTIFDFVLCGTWLILLKATCSVSK